MVGSLAFGLIGVILWSMYRDCADYGEWKFHRCATALVFLTSHLALKLGLPLGGAIAGPPIGPLCGLTGSSGGMPFQKSSCYEAHFSRCGERSPCVL
ncbi:MAG: hypothetical protein JJT96_09220 [Opitutales bacterium]|nr:hypothetical protein [Opitutales bacterium]